MASARSDHAVQAADAGKVVTPFNGRNLDGWKLKGEASQSHWQAGIAKMDADTPRQLAVSPLSPGAKGELVNAKAHGVDIYTVEEFGDCTIRLEFMVPKGSNSGVYVMGEYEIQIYDSYGREKPGMGDVGAVYGIVAPRINAALPPGQWQSMEIVFVAPKFEDGKKVANARISKLTLNDKVIHENLELPRLTPGDVAGKEVPKGPLMFQGNHGPVAYRNIQINVPSP
jgi:hypothetical protein